MSDQDSSPPLPTERSPSHPTPAVARLGVLSQAYTRRIFALVFIGLLLGAVVKTLLTPKGFGVLGHYRVGAIADERARLPLLTGEQPCASCHPEQAAKHDKDVHGSVQCEDCHGSGRQHADAMARGAPLSEGPIFRKLEQGDCLVCHRQTNARPKMFPTVDVKQHFSFLSVSDPQTPCQSCHDPHEPIFLDRKVSESRIHPIIHPCSDCHRDRRVVSRPQPAGHVVTFQCPDCHADIVADFKTKSHRFFECTVCHLFHADSEYAGRIYKITDPRFCLLCHQTRRFVQSREMPQIESMAAHLDQEAKSPEDRTKRCTDCHQERRIHAIRKRPGIAAPCGSTP